MVVVAVVVAAGLGWWLGRSHLGAASPGHASAASPGSLRFRLQGLDGLVYENASFDAPLVVLEFWASWCAPCRAQSKIFGPVYAEYRQRGVAALAVNVAEEQATVADYVGSHPFPFPVALDVQGELSEMAGVEGLPTLMGLGPDGRVRFALAGLVGTRELRQVLDTALAEGTSHQVAGGVQHPALGER